jgi:hypothetical protein
VAGPLQKKENCSVDNTSNPGLRYADRRAALLCQYGNPECHSALAAAFTDGAESVRTAQHLGVIDWCDGSTPSLIVGDTPHAVRKAAVIALHNWATSVTDPAPDVLHSLPDLHDPAAIRGWLKRLADEAPSPEFALLAARDLVRAAQ